jgi:hypothetical protein
MIDQTIRNGAKVVLVVLAALALGVATASAGPEQGKGRVMAKDLAAKTVTVNTDVLEVTSDTVIVDGEGNRIGLRELVVQPEPRPGIFVLTNDCLVTWVADRSGSTLRARRIEVEKRVHR